MKMPLLVVTQDTAFGELIRQSLEETGDYRVGLAGSHAAASAYVQAEQPAIVFLDTGNQVESALEVGRSLRQAQPDIQFVILADDGWQPPVDELSPYGYLPKPFYLPDLLQMLTKFSAVWRADPETSRPAGQPADGLSWLQDVNRAAQHLTRLTLASASQAALITRDDELWAYAGELPQAAARELAATVARYWDHQDRSDLVRFIRLSTTNAEYMLYATFLAPGMTLSLIFDVETSFTTIRSQASSLVRSLSAATVDEAASTAEADPDELPPMTPLADILGSLPPPNPLPPPLGYQDNGIEEIRLGADRPAVFSRESSPAIRRGALIYTEEEDPFQAGTGVETPPDLAVTRKSAPQKKRAAQENLEDTRPRSVSEAARRIVLEPVSPSVYNLNYACLLIPRFPQHHLTGGLSDQVALWLPQVCVAYAWRLEYISIRPDYLLWIASVPPTTSPGHLMRVMRQKLSDKIFAEFPRFLRENPSGDFWAVGNLIMGGSQPPPAQLIKEFIIQIRQQQGISQPFQP